MNERDKFLNDIKRAVNKAIDKICDRYCSDRAYYEFKLICTEITENWQKLREHILIDDNQSFCEFCGKPSRKQVIFPERGEVIICAECLGDKTKSK